MYKNHLLLPLLALITNAFALGKPVFSDPDKKNPLSCFEMPELTVLHPRCESPETGTITVTFPVAETYSYSIDGVNYQSSPFFDLVLPGSYNVSYKEESGCVSEVNTVQVDPAMPFAIINLDAQSSLTQTVCINSAIVPIVYTLGGTATLATVSGLPPGVSVDFSEGVFTISGASSALGIYNFSIVTNGGCQALLNGIIMVKLNAALAWISSSGPRNQTVCRDAPIAPIKHIVANGATGAVATGLPSGIGGTFADGIYTLSGTPDVSGTYNYTINTLGGCSVATVSGIITVNAAPVLDLQCSNTTGSNTMAFEWQAISGVTAYNYFYMIGSGPLVSGTIGAQSAFLVSGVSVGQSVTFTIASVDGGIQCFNPQSVTCTLLPLGNQQFDKGSFSCYPNPVRDILHLEHESQFQSITVFNMFGKKMFERKANENKLQVDLSGLQKGFYMVTATTAEASHSFKIIKD